MDDFEFPALPGPWQERLNADGQNPLSAALDSVDQEVNGVTAFAMTGALPGLTAHTDEQQGPLGHAFAQKWPLDAVHAAALSAAHHKRDRPPAAAPLRVVL